MIRTNWQKQMLKLKKRLERAEKALLDNGWTYTEGTEAWKPPLGKPQGEELENLKQVNELLRYKNVQYIDEINRLSKALDV